MLTLLNKTFISLRTKGLTKTLIKIAKYPTQKNFEKDILRLNGIEDKFTKIYKKNYWENEESVSGPGSTLEYTINLRKKLPELFKKKSIKTIFDAPCGDFNWMRHVLKEDNLDYTGGDIVAPLIESHNVRYKNSNTRFIHIDLTKQKFPSADLMICRDCLFHLSFHDTRLVLQNFVDAQIPYLLTTNHINTGQFKNTDIRTGDFRLIDLFSVPYSFPKEVLFRIEDWKFPDPKREMCLWTKEQIIQALEQFNKI